MSGVTISEATHALFKQHNPKGSSSLHPDTDKALVSTMTAALDFERTEVHARRLANFSALRSSFVLV
jgi:hypothetical protein